MLECFHKARLFAMNVTGNRITGGWGSAESNTHLLGRGERSTRSQSFGVVGSPFRVQKLRHLADMVLCTDRSVRCKISAISHRRIPFYLGISFGPMEDGAAIVDIKLPAEAADYGHCSAVPSSRYSSD